jgi:hypothetical protein
MSLGLNDVGSIIDELLVMHAAQSISPLAVPSTPRLVWAPFRRPRDEKSVAIEDARSLPEDRDCLPQWNEVATGSGTCASSLAALGLGNGMQRYLTGLLKFGTQPNVLSFEPHDTANSFEIHPLRSQLGDAPQNGDVGVAVSTVAALRPSRLDKPTPFVDPQRLRVHARKFGRDRDDIHR